MGAHLSVNLGLRFEPYLPQRNTDNYVEAFSMSNFLASKVGTPPKPIPHLRRLPDSFSPAILAIRRTSSTITAPITGCLA